MNDPGSISELDIALERLHMCAFETADGIANCGPMAAAALEWLGHPALTSGLMDVYVPRFHALGEGTPIAEDEWAAARGEITRVEDWLATFEGVLEAADVSEVLTRSLRVLCESAPVSPDALLRLAFAVDALAREGSEVRQRELAFALAYAAAKPAAVPLGEGDNAWSVRAMEVGGDVNAIGELVGEMCLAGAIRYLAGKDARASHTGSVVVPSSFRLLLPHLPADVLTPLLEGMLLQCAVADAAKETQRSSDESIDSEVERCAESVTEIRYRAACSVHEHAILMAQACLREDAISSDPIFREAAADAALRLSPPGYQEWR